MDGEALDGAPVDAVVGAVPADALPVDADTGDEDLDEDEIAEAPRAPRTNPFGSVWDSQIGTPAASSGTGRAPIVDDEDFDEPEIPEYLIAEQRRGSGAGRSGSGGGASRGGPRGGRSAYRSAIDRERYGGGRSGGINRYPDVSARQTPAREAAQRDAGGGYGRRDQAPAAPRGSGEWSEVPPELEEQLRAQLAQAPAKPAARPVTDVPATPEAETVEAKPKRASTRKPAASKSTTAATADAPEAETVEAKPKRASTRKPAASKSTTAATADAPEAETVEAKPKRASTRKPAASKSTTAATADAPEAETVEAKPKRASTRKPAAADPA